MKHTIYTFTRISAYGDLMELEHFGREENAVAAMEKSVQKRLNLLEGFGWDLNSEKVRVERKNNIVVVNYDESHETFEVTERTIEIETYIV